MKIKQFKETDSLLTRTIGESKMKIADVIVQSGIPKNRLYRLSKGIVKPYLHEALKLSRVLNVSVLFLFDEVK